MVPSRDWPPVARTRFLVVVDTDRLTRILPGNVFFANGPWSRDLKGAGYLDRIVGTADV